MIIAIDGPAGSGKGAIAKMIDEKYPHFRFWCYKVLPLAYDNSLSYYEVLCKVVKYINDLIDQDKIFGDELAALRKDLKAVQKWIDNFDTSYIKDLIDKYLLPLLLYR